MQIPILKILLGLAVLSPAVSAGVVQAREPQNGGRPVPSGQCCVPNTSLKQDTCTAANGATGRCVPGGQPCKPCLNSQSGFLKSNFMCEKVVAHLAVLHKQIWFVMRM